MQPHPQPHPQPLLLPQPQPLLYPPQKSRIIMEEGMRDRVGRSRLRLASFMPLTPVGKSTDRHLPSRNRPCSAPRVNIIYRDCVTGCRGPNPSTSFRYRTQSRLCITSCVCALKDRQWECLSEESAAFRKRPSSGTTRDPVRRRAADCFRSPGTFYHAMTVIAYISVISPLDGGGLYALRAGRCGCDSLSLAGSRQRVKSLRSSVRLRLVL